MKIDENEVEHLVSLMKERGTIHCKFCEDLYYKLKASHNDNSVNVFQDESEGDKNGK